MTINLPPANRANHPSPSPIPFSPTTSTTEGKILHILPPRLVVADQINRLIAQKDTQRNIVFPPNRPATGDLIGLSSMHLETKDSSSSSSAMPLISPSQVTMRPLSPSKQVKLLLGERISFAVTSYEVEPLSELVLFGAKGSMVLKQKGVVFGGSQTLAHLNNRLDYALSLLQKVEAKGDSPWLWRDAQINGLRRICSSRLLQLHHAQRCEEATEQGEVYTKAIDILNGFAFQIAMQRDFHEETKVPVKKAIQPILKHIDQEKRKPDNYKDAIYPFLENVIDYIRPSDSRGQLTTMAEQIDLMTSFLEDKKKQKIAEAQRSKQNYIEELIANIHLLDDPTSHKVIALENQTTMFAIPGGADRHYVSYEFRRELKGKKANYAFVVHDRSFRNSAVAKSMNGTKGIIWKGKSYKKTSLTIKTSKSALTNPRFIEILLRREEHVPYAEIHLFLVELGKGEIVQSDIEPLWDRLYVYHEIKGDVDRFFISPLAKDSITQLDIERSLLALAQGYMNCEQFLSTCGESNMRHEIQIPDDDRVQDGLQLHTIQQHVKPNLLQRLDAIKNTPASEIVCKIATSTGHICITKERYQTDATTVLEQIKLKEDRLLTKLASNITAKDRMEQSIKTARDLLARLDACDHPDLVALKKATQNKFDASRADAKKYLVEHNQDMLRYLALVPDEWRCKADFMLGVLAPHPEHTNPWSTNQQAWFTAWANALGLNLKNSEDFMLKAVAINPMALQAASDTLKDKESFITRICEMHATSDALRHITPWALIHASLRIRSMPKYIDMLLALPTDETAKACLMYLVPDDVSMNRKFIRKFNKPTRTHCSIQ